MSGKRILIVGAGPGGIAAGYRLLEAGFDDVGVLQVTLIASWFNYINRVADALGVGKGDGQG